MPRHEDSDSGYGASLGFKHYPTTFDMMPVVMCSFCKVNEADLAYIGPPDKFICPECFNKGRVDVSDAPLHKLPGGATRSEKKPSYHLAPMDGYRRTVLRFDLGAAIHGPSNWKRSLDTEANAAIFCLEAYNHMIEHALKMGNGVDPEDDHLGAIGWAQTVLCYVERVFGKPWTQLNPNPPEVKGGDEQRLVV